eukprot:7148034-Karenia_brevis.AAC.1
MAQHHLNSQTLQNSLGARHSSNGELCGGRHPRQPPCRHQEVTGSAQSMSMVLTADTSTNASTLPPTKRNPNSRAIRRQ